MEFDNNVPIYQQIMDLVKNRIISGEFKSGDRLKSVRDLAGELGVNPNTVQKALGALEQEKLLITERTSGKFVTSDREAIEKMKTEMIDKMTRDFLDAMARLGIRKAEILKIITNFEGDDVNECGYE